MKGNCIVFCYLGQCANKIVIILKALNRPAHNDMYFFADMFYCMDKTGFAHLTALQNDLIAFQAAFNWLANGGGTFLVFASIACFEEGIITGAGLASRYCHTSISTPALYIGLPLEVTGNIKALPSLL